MMHACIHSPIQRTRDTCLQYGGWVLLTAFKFDKLAKLAND